MAHGSNGSLKAQVLAAPKAVWVDNVVVEFGALLAVVRTEPAHPDIWGKQDYIKEGEEWVPRILLYAKRPLTMYLKGKPHTSDLGGLIWHKVLPPSARIHVPIHGLGDT